MTEICGEYIPVVMLLFLATKQDLNTGKISNRLILTGYGWGMACRMYINGVPGLVVFIIRAAWPVVLLYGLFLVRALGAGDIKLFSAISVFLNKETVLSVILISFFIGAGIACTRILRYLVQKKILGISTDRFERKIKFSVCIAFGFFLRVLGDLLF